MHARIIPPPVSDQAAATVLAGGEDTGGRFSLIHVHCLRGGEPPLHRHHHEDVVIHVLQGELAFRINDVTHYLGSGATVLVPRGIEHGYALRSDTADLLMLLTPAGAETCVGSFHESDTSIEHMVIAAAHHGIEITGPASHLTTSDTEHLLTSAHPSPILPGIDT